MSDTNKACETSGARPFRLRRAWCLVLLILGSLSVASCAATGVPGQSVDAASGPTDLAAASPVPGSENPIGGSSSDTTDLDSSTSAGGYVPQPGSASADLARSDAQGQVEVTVVPTAWTVDAAGTLEFEVSLNTHSVDLSMDLAQLAILETDTGMSLPAIDWTGGAGHHVTGLLRFPAGDPEGRAVLQDASRLTLTIRDLDASTKVFEWDVAVLP